MKDGFLCGFGIVVSKDSSRDEDFLVLIHIRLTELLGVWHEYKAGRLEYG